MYLPSGVRRLVARIGPAALCASSASAEGSGQRLDGKQFDAVIVGYGVAGRAAYEELRKSNLSILVIDPRAVKAEWPSTSHNLATASVTRLGLVSRSLTLSDASTITYKALLISTGAFASGSAALPASYLDPGMPESDDSILDLSDPLALEQLRQEVVAGKHVTILGAGSWASVSAALYLAREASAAGFCKAVTLLSANGGVLFNSLPRNLSVAISRRLSNRRGGGAGIEVVPYSVVRFVGGSDVSAALGSVEGANARNVVFVANALDSMDTSMFFTDRVAALPPLALPPTGSEGLGDATSPNHFALLGGPDAPALELGELGGLQCNASLSAAEGVFVAGDACNVFIPPCGRGVYSGWEHAETSGAAAGRNMRAFLARSPSPGASVYSHTPAYVAVGGAEVGIHLVLLGNCSAALDSHAFFWRVSSTPASASASASASSSKSTAAEPASAQPTGIVERLQSALGLGLGVGAGASGGEGAAMTRVRALGRAGLMKISAPPTQTVATAPPPPPLGLGVILFVGTDGRVAGVAVTGMPPSSFSPLVHAAARAALHEDLSAKSSQELLAEASSKPTAGSFDLGGGDRWDPQWEATRLRRLRNMQRLAQTIVHSACGAASPELMPRPNYRFTARTKTISPSARAVCVLPDKITSGATDVSSKDRIAAAYVRGLRGGGG